MSNWKDRSEVVPAEASTNDWKSRSVEEPPSEAPKDPSLMTQIHQGSEDIIRGGAQGLTLGFSDEMLAAMKAGGTAAMDALPGGSELKNAEEYLKLYRAKQQEEQAANDLSKERSPYLYHGSEIGSAFIPAILSSGATAGTSAAGIGLRQAFKEGGKKGVAKQLGKAALHGGAVGTVAGVGGSHGTLEGDPSTIAKDALIGGTAGAALGTAMKAGGALFKGKAPIENPNAVPESPGMNQTKIAYEKGKAGLGYGDSASNMSRQAAEQNQSIDAVRSVFDASERQLQGEKQALLDAASKAGVLIESNVDSKSAAIVFDVVTDSNAGIRKSLWDETRALLEGYTRHGIAPEHADKLRANLHEIGKDSASETVKNAARILNKEIDKGFNSQVPGYSNINKEISSFLQAGKETLIRYGDSADAHFASLSNTASPQLKVEKSIERMLENLRSGKSGALDAQGSLDELIQNLHELPPELVKKLGINPDVLRKEIVNHADGIALQKTMSGPATSGISVLGTHLPGKKTIMKAANVAGQAVRFAEPLVSPIASPIAKSGKALYSAGRETLDATAGALAESQVPGLTNLGDALAKGIASGNEAKKNAVLFSIMQNPEARKLLGIDLSSENE